MKVVTALFLTVGAAEATSFAANSPGGLRVLRSAKVVEHHPELRHLEDVNYNYEQEQREYDNGDVEIQGLSYMYLKYLGCSQYQVYDGNYQQEDNQQAEEEYDYEMANQQNGYQDYGYQQQADNDGWEYNRLIRFTLCKTSSCGRCSGEYVVDMATFVDAYTESMLNEDMYACEQVRENCYCWGNSQSCYQDCFAQKGENYYQTCSKFAGSNEYFDMQEYVDCGRMRFYHIYDGSNGWGGQAYQNQNNYGGQGGQFYGNGNYNGNRQRNFYYLGLTCLYNRDIYIEAYYDDQCSYKVDKSSVEEVLGGNALPFYYEPLLSHGECMTCMDREDMEEYYQEQYENAQREYEEANEEEEEEEWNENQGWNQDDQLQYYNNGNQEDDRDANDLCQTIEESVACDTKRGYYSGCTFVESLSGLDGRDTISASQAYENLKESLKRSRKAAYVLAGGFVVAVATLAMMVGYCCTTSPVRVNRSSLLAYRHSADSYKTAEAQAAEVCRPAEFS